MAPLLGNLLGKQVLEVELGLDGAEHEVGVVEAQVLLVGVGGEGATAACPVLERGGRGLAGERAHMPSLITKLMMATAPEIAPQVSVMPPMPAPKPSVRVKATWGSSPTAGASVQATA